MKSQLKNIWKNWFSFIGIFILVFLTSGSLSAGSNTNNIYKNLDKSLIFPYKVSYSFNENGMKNISKHFFGGKKLTYEEESKIRNNQILEPTDNNAKMEIEKWNYNFKAWTLQQILIKEGLNNQLAVDYQINKVMIQSGFNDNNWTINQGKYNLKIIII
ncbi:hypothetical protein [Spiroplasma sp. AdecLV25b]|uniref:hypothetical protein n=1 Tax=Spiroplasma sp. AdecLV25b TaxID=3027162 RepID=UPI0027E13E86|nr:hypothetical protein [Spiroplasma sp. AdecLV25b]